MQSLPLGRGGARAATARPAPSRSAASVEPSTQVNLPSNSANIAAKPINRRFTNSSSRPTVKWGFKSGNSGINK